MVISSLARLSEIKLEKSQYREAVPLLERLEKEASSEENRIYAQSNLMKSYDELDRPDLAASYAEKVLRNSQADTRAKTDAQLIVARSAIKNGDEARAKAAYAEVQKNAKGELAAEALYYDAYFKHKAGNYEASNAAVQILAKDFSGYKRWGAKGLVLMGKNFYQLDDAYQATYILENVIKNFGNYPDIVQEAETELSRIQAEKAKTNSSVETLTR